jgi:hypothetical protein
MHLIEILLPLHDNKDRSLNRKPIAAARDELTELYGGVTAFNRAPATGESREGNRIVRDEIIVLRLWLQRSTATGGSVTVRTLKASSTRMKSSSVPSLWKSFRRNRLRCF